MSQAGTPVTWDEIAEGHMGMLGILMNLQRNPHSLFLAGSAPSVFGAITGSRRGEELWDYLKKTFPTQDKGIDVNGIAFAMCEHVHPTPTMAKNDGRHFSGPPHKQRLKRLADDCEQLEIVARMKAEGCTVTHYASGKKAANAALYFRIGRDRELVADFCWYPANGFFNSNLIEKGTKGEVTSDSQFKAKVSELLSGMTG